MPFSEIKIDRCFITGINEDHFSQTIVNTLNEITKGLDLDLIAEGVETFEEHKYLEDLGSKILVQGYIISKPKPKDEFLHWYHSWMKVCAKGG